MFLNRLLKKSWLFQPVLCAETTLYFQTERGAAKEAILASLRCCIECHDSGLKEEEEKRRNLLLEPFLES